MVKSDQLDNAISNSKNQLDKSYNERIEALRGDVVDLGIMGAEHAWFASEIHSQYVETSKYLNEISEGYAIGKVPMKAIGKLINNTAISKMSHARWHYSRMDLRGTFYSENTLTR